MTKMYSDKEIDNMGKGQLNVFFKKLQKEYEELEQQYNNLDDEYRELEDENYDLQTEVDNLEGQIGCIEDLVDMDYLKEKLELYGFKTEELWNFLDDYMRLYNK